MHVIKFLGLRRLSEQYAVVGLVKNSHTNHQKKSTKLSKSYKSGDHFIHNVLSYRGVILYSWPGKVVCGDGNSFNEKFYQVLVDQRDAEELPIEHELLRISDTDRESLDFVST